MVHLQYDIACCISVLFILSLAEASFLDYLNLKVNKTDVCEIEDLIDMRFKKCSAME